MKILVLNGPNINMLGIREPGIYGKENYQTLVTMIEAKAKELGVGVDVRQTNWEGQLVDWIQQAYGVFDGIVISSTSFEENEAVDLLFLDGHYTVRLLPCSGEVFRVEFIEDEGLESEKIVDTFDVETNVFLQEILSALDACIAFVTGRGQRAERLHAAKEIILHLK